MPIQKNEFLNLIEPRASIEEISSISSDGRNLLTRIPKRILKEASIRKGQNIRWLFENKKVKIEIINDD